MRIWPSKRRRRSPRQPLGEGPPAFSPFEPRACPYCLGRFALSPERDTHCPACGEYVWVMRDRETGGRFLLTKEQARLLREDDERAARQARPPSEAARPWLARLEQLQALTWLDFERARADAPAGSSDEDVVWDLLAALLRQPRPYAQLAALCELRAEWGQHRGLEFEADLRRARALELLHLQKTLPESPVWIVGGGCGRGRELDGRALPLARALRTLPLPDPACTHVPSGRGVRCDCRFAAAPPALPRELT